MKRRSLVIAAALVVAMLALGAVLAVAVEPADNTPYGAVGPLVSGKEATGTISATDDADYYFFWVSANSTATVDFVPAPGSEQQCYVQYYMAGFVEDWVFMFDPGELHDTSNYGPGLYYAVVYSSPSAEPYSLTVTGSKLTSVQPPNGQRPKGYVGVTEKAGDDTYKGAILVKPAYDYEGYLSAADNDWFCFYVTSTSDVYLGAEGGAIVLGDLYNSKISRISAVDNAAHKFRLAPGKYYIRWRWAPGFGSGGGGRYHFAVMGSYVTTAPYAKLTTPYGPTSIAAGKYFKSYGQISPKHTVGTKAVTIQAYQNVGGKWVLRKSVPATISAYNSTASRYSASLSLWKGSWRLRAYHRDARHLASYSGYRYITVK